MSKVVSIDEEKIIIKLDDGKEVTYRFDNTKNLSDYTKDDLKIFDNQLAHATQMMCVEYPFHGFITMGLIKTFSDQFSTMAVTQEGIHHKLFVNPSFWERLTPKQQIGLVLHEISHIAFFHTFIDNRMYENPELLSIAVDIVVNQYIKREYLPDEGCFLEGFPELNLEKERDVDYYYLQLKKDYDKNQNQQQGDSNGNGKSKSSSGKSEILKALKAVMNALGENNIDKSGTIEIPGVGKLKLSDHSGFNKNNKTGEELSDTQKQLLESQTLHILNDAAESARSCGKMPGHFEEILSKKNIKPKPKWNYHKFIRRFSGNTSSTYVVNTRMRPNYLIQENPGIKTEGGPSVLVGLDISGSMSKKLLTSLQNDLTWMIRQDYEVTVAQFDTELKKVEKYDNKKGLKLYGRGGTDFNAILEYFAEHQREYSCLIVLSDGGAEAPRKDIQVPKTKVLWCFTEDNYEEFPGLKVRINDNLECE